LTNSIVQADKVQLFTFSFDELQVKHLASPAYEYSSSKEIPIGHLELSACAHRDNGMEVCVGGFMFFQYTKYEEELRRKAKQVSQLSHSSSNNFTADDGDLQLYFGDDSEQFSFGRKLDQRTRQSSEMMGVILICTNM
jgi:hypothetical protein